MPKNKKKKSSLKILWIVIAIVLVAAICFGVLYLMKQQKSTDADRSDDSYNAAAEIDDDDPNKDDINKYTQGDDNKDRLEDEQTSSTDTDTGATSGTKNAVIAIGYAGAEDENIVAGAEITNLVEEEGSCEYTFTSPSGKTYSAEADTLPSAKSTPCASASITKSETGTWSLIVKYKSSAASGTSDIYNFEVK